MSTHNTRICDCAREDDDYIIPQPIRLTVVYASSKEILELPERANMDSLEEVFFNSCQITHDVMHKVFSINGYAKKCKKVSMLGCNILSSIDNTKKQKMNKDEQ